MGSFTCEILVGHSHSNHGGIIPTHVLFLSENDRPAWILNSLNLFSKSNNASNVKTKEIVWIPTIENMLEDALLMLGIYVLKDSSLIDAAKKFFKKDIFGDRLELYEDIEKENLLKLYKMCRNIDIRYKIVITTLDGSSINEKALKCLLNYSMDVEVCKSIYRREYSEWTGDYIVKGELVGEKK
ncbi:hypothetical protein [Thermovenabulum gondwanense]|uniref:Uncharacterized protein n=1 Tax=Thermovenabulum gondwanense TaxID=520767 RepID=A0A162MQR5_9FIRM|nr:hypothetical protein [Thermovenabulum gondwanense]KYO66961.1 hypothetical protein ATZ99_07780 [Thermovenabulum gondwanense]